MKSSSTLFQTQDNMWVVSNGLLLPWPLALYFQSFHANPWWVIFLHLGVQLVLLNGLNAHLLGYNPNDYSYIHSSHLYMKMCSRCLSKLGSHFACVHLFRLAGIQVEIPDSFRSRGWGPLGRSKVTAFASGFGVRIWPSHSQARAERYKAPVSCRFVSTFLLVCECGIGFQNLQTCDPSAQELQASQYSWFCQDAKTVRWRLSADWATKVRFAMWSSTTSDRRWLAWSNPSHPC